MNAFLRFCAIYTLFMTVGVMGIVPFVGNIKLKLPQPQRVAIEQAITGEQAPQGTGVQFFPMQGLHGQLIYSYDTSITDTGEYRMPWENFLVARQLGTTAPRVMNGDIPERIFSHKIHLPSDRVIRRSIPSPGRVWIALAIGQFDPANNHYELYMVNPTTQQVIPVGEPGSQVMNDTNPIWSPDSRYLAYFYGGYVAFERYWPQQLWVYDRRTCATHMILGDASSEVAWISSDRLLYSVYPDSRPAGSSKERTPVTRPGIYRIDPAGKGKAVRIIPNATQPAVSPDGKWIAAFITRFKDTGEDRFFQRRLAIYPRKGGNPIEFPLRADGNYVRLLWSPDNRHLIFATEITASDGHVRFVFYDCALQPKKVRLLATIPNAGAFEFYGPELGVLPLGVSKDGRYLYFQHSLRIPSKPNSRFLNAMRYLKVIDINTHQIHTLFQMEGFGEFEVAGT